MTNLKGPEGEHCRLTGKLIYRDPKHAERRRQVIKKRRNEKLSVYRCHECRGWHLGHDDYGIRRRAS